MKAHSSYVNTVSTHTDDWKYVDGKNTWHLITLVNEAAVYSDTEWHTVCVCVCVHFQQDGSVLQTVVAGSGAVQNIVWVSDVGVAVCSNRSKASCLIWLHCLRHFVWLYLSSVKFHLPFIWLDFQDVLVVNCSKEFMASNHVLATCRTALKKQGVVGLNLAPCMRAFLERLPVMLQEQYAYEKVKGDMI